MDSFSDEQLIALYANGDIEAFNLLYMRHKGGIYRYCLRQLHSTQLVDDIFQDIWSKVIQSAEQYSPNAKFSTWLYTLARNAVIDHVRHIKVVNKVMVEPKGGDNACLHDEDSSSKIAQVCDSESSLLQHQQAIALKHCMQKLPSLQLDCFVLREESNLSVTQIAIVVDASIEATKSRLRYAYQSLRHCLNTKIGGGHDS